MMNKSDKYKIVADFVYQCETKGLSHMLFKNPAVEFKKAAESGELDYLTDEEYEKEKELVELKSLLWGNKKSTEVWEIIRNAIIYYQKDEAIKIIRDIIYKIYEQNSVFKGIKHDGIFSQHWISCSNSTPSESSVNEVSQE